MNEAESPTNRLRGRLCAPGGLIQQVVVDEDDRVLGRSRLPETVELIDDGGHTVRVRIHPRATLEARAERRQVDWSEARAEITEVDGDPSGVVTLVRFAIDDGAEVEIYGKVLEREFVADRSDYRQAAETVVRGSRPRSSRTGASRGIASATAADGRSVGHGGR